MDDLVEGFRLFVLGICSILLIYVVLRVATTAICRSFYEQKLKFYQGIQKEKEIEEDGTR